MMTLALRPLRSEGVISVQDFAKLGQKPISEPWYDVGVSPIPVASALAVRVRICEVC